MGKGILILPEYRLSCLCRGDDGNVPPWHSREAVGVLESWRQNANVECA